MKLPYFYQQMLGFLSVILVLLSVTVISLIHFARNTALQSTEESLYAYADTLIDNNFNYEDLEKTQQLLNNQGVSFLIFDLEGEVLFPRINGLTVYGIPNELTGLEQGERVSLISEQRDLFGNPQETAIVLVPYQTSDSREIYIAVSAPISQVDEQMNELQKNLFNAFLISTVVAIVMSFIFARYQVNRINRLRNATHKVTEGEYDVRIAHKNRDEVDSLSSDFNKMVIALKDSQQELERQEERRKTFMQDAAHEMRTPLTTINGLLEGLEYGVIKEDKRVRSIQLMRNETKRMIRLVNENLDYENIRSNRIMLSKHEIPVTEVLGEITEQMTRIAEKSGDKMVVEGLDGLKVYADYDRFKQIMVNLIKNAIQFTKDGTILITGEKIENGSRIIVKDTGIGMTEEQLKNIWDRYYKADVSRKNTKYGESGLGLAIVKELIELHGATIEVESELGKGTSFILTIPDKLESEENQI